MLCSVCTSLVFAQQGETRDKECQLIHISETSRRVIPGSIESLRSGKTTKIKSNPQHRTTVLLNHAPCSTQHSSCCTYCVSCNPAQKTHRSPLTYQICKRQRMYFIKKKKSNLRDNSFFFFNRIIAIIVVLSTCLIHAKGATNSFIRSRDIFK